MKKTRLSPCVSSVRILPFIVSLAVAAQCSTAIANNAGQKSFPNTLVTPVSKFRKIDRERVIAAKLQGQREITLLIAATTGANSSLVDDLMRIGAVIRFRDDTLDYLRIRVPLDRIDQIVNMDRIQVVAVDGVQMYFTTQDLPSNDIKLSTPDSGTDPENPFLPTREIGAPQFIREHPSYDGRGVVIANIDGNTPDPLAPELQKATSLDGSSVQKIIDVLNALDPDDDASRFRVDMSTQVEVRQNQFELNGQTYSCSSDGNYRLGFFDLAGFGGGLLRQYLPADRSQKALAILWDEKSNLVWVDTNLDHSFRDETSLSDFNLSHRFGVLGHDDPATPLRETVAFTLLINKEHKLIYFAPLANGHATGTASVAAGNGFLGGRMNGVAPGAQIISVLRDSVTHAMIEGMIQAVRNPKVDLISLQWAALIPPQDGNSVVGLVFERLIDRYRKPIFSGADNLGPGISTNDEPAAVTKVISVGGYVNRRTWQSNYGVISSDNDTIINLSSRGPRVDGGFKPDIVAPAATLAADFGVQTSRWKLPVELPSGYEFAAGTSMACPMASGAAALLISAAKQEHIPYDAERIRWALKSSARYLPNFGAHEQGSGLINVAAAWESLKRASDSVTISSFTQINVVVGSYLKTPNHGPGIYEREGWQTGQTGQRTILFTRSSGPKQPKTYLVRWTGNDGTFTSLASLRLPLNKPVPLVVTIKVTTSGEHSAIIDLDDPDGARSVYQVMNTVIAAAQFSAKNDFTVTTEGTASYPSYVSYFYHVPKKASALQVSLKLIAGSVRLRLMRPSGKEFDHPYDTPVHWFPQYQTGGTIDRTLTNPEPGVWQVIIENESLAGPEERTADVRKARFSIVAQVFGTTAESVPEKKQIRFISYYAPFNGEYGDPLVGSAFSTSLTFRKHQSITYEINIPSGSEYVSARVTSPTDRSDVDLYLYSCDPKCELKAYSTRTGPNEYVSVSSPKSGKWKVVIDPVSICSGDRISYTDVFTHPSLGTLTTKNRPGFNSRSIPNEEIISSALSHVVSPRRVVGVIRIVKSDPGIVKYEYSELTKKVEAIRERVTLGEALIEMPVPMK